MSGNADKFSWLGTTLLLFSMFFTVTAVADESTDPGGEEAENASNPLAAVDNTDLRWQYFDLEHADRQDAYIDGAKMLSPKLKLKYELHYWDTDVRGQSENGLESLHLKFIYFPMEGKWKGIPYRLAVGAEWIKDLGDIDKGIGSGGDQIAPLAGVAMQLGDTTLIPLVQHFQSYSGEDISQTSIRLIGIKPLAGQSWLKLDAKVPYDWENRKVPASVELQLGKSFSRSFGAYIDGLAGLGSDRAYDWGIGVGLRFNY
jgi:hypothetical protein